MTPSIYPDRQDLGGNSGSREPSPSGLGPTGFDPRRVTQAREAWARILNMDCGQPQQIAAAMWASIYADTLLNQGDTL